MFAVKHLLELTVTKNDCNNVDRKHKSKAKESYFVINTERHGFPFIKRMNFNQ